MNVQLRTHVKFMSDRFSDPSSHPPFYDPQPGKDCAEYLSKRLTLTFPDAKDAEVQYDEPNWNLYLSIAGRSNVVIINSIPGDEVDENRGRFCWLVRSYISRRFLELMLRRDPPQAELLAVATALRPILASDDRIWNVKWLSEKEFQQYVLTGAWAPSVPESDGG